MSEYQYLEFRAVDRPLTDAEMVYARKQSTRAEISRWSFQNEYHYGNFQGNVIGLLLRGYDVHLHYANFGVRTVALRLPAGLPFPKSVWSQYVGVGGYSWSKDRSGNAGILSLSPTQESGEIEEIWNPAEYMDDMVAVRSRIVSGDLRALYVLWLCAASDDQSDSPDVVEPPVPAGLAASVDTYGSVLQFFGIDPLILLAASEGTPNPPKEQSQQQQIRQWVDGLCEAKARRLLMGFLMNDVATTKAKAIAQVLKTAGTSDWRSVHLHRTFQTLLDRTVQLRAEQKRKDLKKHQAAEKRKAAKKEKERKDRMKLMVSDPRAWLRRSEKLVDARGVKNYQAAAELLADLRKAIGGEEGEQMVRGHAVHLVKTHPTLRRLKSSLRKVGLWESGNRT